MSSFWRSLASTPLSMSVQTPLHWAGTGSYSSVAANVATVTSPGNWSNSWSHHTAITKGDGVFVFELQVSRSHSRANYSFFGFTLSGHIPHIQSSSNTPHIGPNASYQTLGFGTDGKAYFGSSVVAQPLAAGAITFSQPYTVTLTVDMDAEIIGCTITQSAVTVRGQMKFAQCGVTKDNAKELRVLASWVSDVQGTAMLHQRTEKSAAQLAKEAAAAAKAQADAEVKRQAAARPLLEPSELRSLVSGSLFADCKRTVTDAELPVRVAVVGRMGVGKSSVVTLLLSAFQDDHKTRIVRRAKVAAQDDHVTSQITEYRLGAADGAAGGVVLVDTWGYSDDNWSEFSSFLDGKLMNGFEKGGSLAPRAPNIRSNMRYADRIHAVIFVVSAQEADADVEGSYAQRLKFFTATCDQQDIPFLLVATKADELVRGSSAAAFSSSSSSLSDNGGAGELFDTQLLFKDANVITTVQRISKLTGVPRGQIFPVKGYTDETVRNRRLETTALRALAEAVELAIERYDAREKEDALSAQMRRAKVAPDAADDADAFGRDAQFGSGQRR